MAIIHFCLSCCHACQHYTVKLGVQIQIQNYNFIIPKEGPFSLTVQPNLHNKKQTTDSIGNGNNRKICSGLSCVGCLDTLAAMQELKMGVASAEEETQAVMKVYSKEDYSVVNRFESKWVLSAAYILSDAWS